MKKIFAFIMAAMLVLSMLPVTVFAAGEVVYVDYANGSDSNDGLSASSAKKSIDNKGTGAMQYTKENGGTVVASGKLYFGGNYTIKTNRGGLLTITANDGKADYQNPRPATNPEAGAMKLSKDAVLTIATDVTITDIILFHEYDTNPGTIKVADGATLTITKTVNCMSKGSQYYNIVVEKGGTAIIEGGTFSSITGEGTIQKSNDVIISAGYVDPNAGEPGTVFLNYGAGNDANDGKTDATAKKLFGGVNGAGAIGAVKYGGTVIVSGKAYVGADYTMKDHEGPVTFTSVYNGKDYKNAEPATNPACALKLGAGKTFTIAADVTLDNLILFNEAGGTFKVANGGKLTVTDSVVLMDKVESGYNLVIESGATVVLSDAAQQWFNITNNGGKLEKYASSAPTTPIAPEVTEKTEVKITVNSKTAYVNGKAETLTAPAINRSGRVLLPVRFLANAFGVSNDGIAWDAATRTATLKNDTVTIVVTIDAPSMTVNGETVALDSPAIISDNSTYLPVRAIANALGVANENIAWDAATNTATLVK